MAAMLLIMRPMKESTTSSEEMSMSTPRARAATIRLVRASCNCIASWSCISTCTVTRRNRPIFRIGIFSMEILSGRRAQLLRQPGLRALQGDGEGIGKRGFRGDFGQIHTQVDDGLCYLRADSADDAVCAHQAR